MTPKEKAEELVDKYINLYPSYIVMFQGDIDEATKNIKQCALITTKETIESLEVLENTIDKIDNVNLSIFSAISYQIEYWKDVEQEIKNIS